LKKQSQFSGEQIGVSPYVKGDYGKMLPCGVRKNKANLHGARNGLSSLSSKTYSYNLKFPPSENKANLSPQTCAGG
jgi:hypothetical protein